MQTMQPVFTFGLLARFRFGTPDVSPLSMGRLAWDMVTERFSLKYSILCVERRWPEYQLLLVIELTVSLGALQDIALLINAEGDTFSRWSGSNILQNERQTDEQIMKS